MRHLALLSLLLTTACAPATGKGTTPVVDKNDQGTPPRGGERPVGGFGPLIARMDAMGRDAEAIIDRVRATSGDATTRYRLAEMEIHFAMRDEFGPANGDLFAKRSKKLKELAGAVGTTSAPEPPAFAIDDFVRETRSFAEQIRSAGYVVEESPVQSAGLLWAPDVVGWQFLVRDTKRTVNEDVPYSGSPHGPPKAATPLNVNPTIRVYVFPHLRMSAAQSMVKREQPGEPMAAGASTVLFRLQAAQSHDQDPGGEIGKKVEAALFRESAKKELAAAATALGGGSAMLERGLLRVSGRGDAPTTVPELGAPEVRLVLWSAQQGADIDHTLLPLH